MFALLRFFLALFSSLFKSKSRLEAENAALRRQLIVLQRKVRGRVHFTNSDRLFLIQLYRWFPSILKVITIIRPETVVRWHRAGFRRYWRWKSRSLGGRPQVEADLRALIRRMSVDNPLWGAPRIHGEMLKLGFEIAEFDGFQVHDPAPRAAIADVADISAQPCGRHCGDRSVSGSNPDIPVLVCVSGRGPRSTPATVVCSDPAGDGGVAGATDRGSISVGHRADLFGARQRWCAGLHKANSSDGDSGPPDFTEIALAEPIC